MFSESHYMNIIEQYDKSIWIFYILERTHYAIKNILMIIKNIYSWYYYKKALPMSEYAQGSALLLVLMLMF